MPSRNIVKINSAESYYHVYARGINKQIIFVEPADYTYFINLFARYLSSKPCMSKQGIPYPNYSGSVELIAYCLMNNHFHLLLYQSELGAMSKLMQGIMTSYGRYFNLKYKRSGSLYESTYKASMVTTDTYLQHISRYIHLNPRYWKQYKASSIRYYLGPPTSVPQWLNPYKILDLFASSQEYKVFLEDYEDHKQMLDEVKHNLADH